MAPEAKILYTTAPAEFDREASQVLRSLYVHNASGLPLRKVLVPGPDFAVQFNAYLKHIEYTTVPEAMIARLLHTGTIADTRDAQRDAYIARTNDMHDKEHDMPARNADEVTEHPVKTRAARKPRTNNTATTVTVTESAIITTEHPANVPQAPALDGMTPLGVPETTPDALDTPAEQAAAQPKTRRGKKGATTLSTSHPELATVGAQSMPAPLTDEQKAVLAENATRTDAPLAPKPLDSITTALATGVVERPAADVPPALRQAGYVGEHLPRQSDAFEVKVAYLRALLTCDVATIQGAFRDGFVDVGTREKAPRAASTFTPNPHSKMAQMTFAIAGQIRAEAAKKELSQKQLAAKFDTTRIMIWDILHGVRFVVESEGSKTRPKAQWTK